MNKVYERINWENEPSIATPLGASNLNKTDYAINEIDNRVIALDTGKANQSDLLLDIKSVAYNSTTGVWTFTHQNGTTDTFDQNIEKIPVTFSMDANGVITMTTADGTTYTCDVGTLIKTITFVNSGNIQFTVTTDAQGNKSVTASVIDGSITRAKLDPDYLAQIDLDVASASASATAASGSATTASNKALDSEAYAIGTRGGVPVTSGDPAYENNSKYYAEHGASSLAGLTDVNVSDVTNGQVIKYNSTTQKWENDDESGGGGILPHLIIISETGSTVTATKGQTVITATETSTGHYECDLPEFGTYTITGTISGTTVTTTLYVDTVKVYNTSVFAIYGIRRSTSTSDSVWERTDKAVDALFSASVGSSAGYSSFDNFSPWSGIERVTVGSDVLVKIPKFYYRRYIEDGYEYIKICDTPAPNFTLHPAFDRDGTIYDYIYVGAYYCDASYNSASGSAPKVSTGRTTFRANIQNKGTGYYIMDIAIYNAICMLIMVEIADFNVQSKIGRGRVNGSSLVNNGTCDAVPNLTGRPSGTDGDSGVVWRGIENLWGNAWHSLEGIINTANLYYVTNDPSKFSDSDHTGYSEIEHGTLSPQAWISSVTLDDDEPSYILPYSISSSGTSTTFVTDKVDGYSSPYMIYTGGTFGKGDSCGLFCILGADVDVSFPDLGARLMYLPQ